MSDSDPHEPSSDAAAFERGLIEHPGELVRWCAYSDWLTEQGDPRGEFMRVQLALEDEALTPAQRDALKEEEAALLAAHEAKWLGPLAAFTVNAAPVARYTRDGTESQPPVLHRFERGRLAVLEFSGLTVNQARAFAASAAARLVRELVVVQVAAEIPEGTTRQYIDTYYAPGPDVPAGIDPYADPGLHALCRCPHLAAVRSFRLGHEADGGYGHCHTGGDMAHHVVRHMPLIEDLELCAHRVDAGQLFALPMPELRSLVLFHNTSYPLDALAANPTVGNLTTLRCHPHALEYGDEEQGAYIRLEHLRAVCRSQHLTKLTHLCLRLSNFGDDGAKEIAASGILRRLKVLDLEGGCMSDIGAAALVACPEFKNLEDVNLCSNALSEAGVAAVEATGVKSALGGQHTSTAGTSDDEPAEYLYEGDWE